MPRSNFTVLDVVQRSSEWRQARCGRLCASRAADMLAKLKGPGEAAARRDLRLQLVVEKLTGQPQDEGFVSFDMKRGEYMEAEARLAYEAESGNLVRSIGFVQHAELAAGYSPDGVVGAFDLLLEIKCPRSATHLRYLREQRLPAEYVGQTQHALWITGAPGLDFFSYDPRFPAALRTFSIHVARDEQAMRAYELIVRMFLREVDEEFCAVSRLMEAAA